MNSNGYWEYDGFSDFSRIQRQDAFFRAVLAKINSAYNPLTINASSAPPSATSPSTTPEPRATCSTSPTTSGVCRPRTW